MRQLPCAIIELMFFSLSRYDSTLDVECLAVNDWRWGMLVQYLST
jgi:hypothetical protein